MSTDSPYVLLKKLGAAAGVGVISEGAVVAVRGGGSSMGEGYNGVEPHVGPKGLSDGSQQRHISHVGPVTHTQTDKSQIMVQTDEGNLSANM